MDVARFSYRKPCRFFRDSDIEADIVWYRAPKGARFFPTQHRFGSSLWLHDKVREPGDVGEVVDAFASWRSGATPPRVTGQRYVGPTEWFQLGVPYDASAPLVLRDLDGITKRCRDGVAGGEGDGGFMLAGEASASWAAAPYAALYEGGGSIRIAGGDWLSALGAEYASDGGFVVLGSSSDAVVRVVLLSQGDLLLSGVCSASWEANPPPSYPSVMSGGLALGGESPASWAAAPPFTDAAAEFVVLIDMESWQYAGFQAVADGGFVLTGLAMPSGSVGFAASGGISVSGLAQSSPGELPAGVGGLTLSGSASASSAGAAPPAGEATILVDLSSAVS